MNLPRWNDSGSSAFQFSTSIGTNFRFVLVAALLWFAPDSPMFAAETDAPPKRIRGEVIINRTAAPWESQQVQEPCILPNPKDPTRLVMFYSGVPATNRNTCFIGKAWALKSDPFTWHQDEHNPVFSPGKSGWDSGSIRLDAVLYLAEEDAYYIYYSGTTGSIQDRIGLAICPVGTDGYSGITPPAIQRVGTQPVLAPEPAAPYYEEMASQAAVLREWNEQEQRWDWFMYYSYRGKDGILPGLRLATSHDGKTWMRHFNEKDPRGMGQIFPSTPAPTTSGIKFSKSATPTCSPSRSASRPANAGGPSWR
ncbi:MAG: hypothetical protein V9H26_24660 [Verrucomicrobiota bacterium]